MRKNDIVLSAMVMFVLLFFTSVADATNRVDSHSKKSEERNHFENDYSKKKSKKECRNKQSRNKCKWHCGGEGCKGKLRPPKYCGQR